MPTIIDLLVSHAPEGPNVVDRLDKTLADLSEPTPFRGLVQFFRATALSASNRPSEARDAVEESIRLLPGYSGPLLTAASIEAYADRPARATDYIIRASEIDPHIVRNMPDREIGNLRMRLSEQNEAQRRQQLSERLFAIGWAGNDLALRSSMARELIEKKVDAGDIAGARLLVPKIVAPGSARSLLMQNRYREIWPDIERWGGERQEKLWPTYLSELRSRWAASRDLEDARPYVEALQRADRYDVLIEEMLPLFSEELDPGDDYDLQWVIAPLANALARQNRWAEVGRVFETASAVWPLGSDANALNVVANWGAYRFFKGDVEGGAETLQAAIDDAGKWQGDVSIGGLQLMHQYLACALHRLGRDAEALPSITIANDPSRSPTSIAYLRLCLDKPDQARKVLIDALDNEQQREDVIAFVQSSDDPPFQSDYGRMMSERMNALREDPLILKAVEKYGRILPPEASEAAFR